MKASFAKQGLSEDDLVAEILALLMFGHDTVAAALSWAFVHLCSHPSIARRIREEWVSEDSASQPMDTAGISYAQACMHESLRLTPVVVHVTRVARQRMKIGVHTLEAGDKVFPCTYLAHRNPQVYADPTVFLPERFISRNTGYDSAYFPFGIGSRTCVGRPFALRQMTLVLGTAFSEYDFEFPVGYVARPARKMVLIVPSDDTPLVRRR